MGYAPPHEVLFFPATPAAGIKKLLALPTRPFRLAVVGNYPPTRCGIATFTADMVAAVERAAPSAGIDVYALDFAGEAKAPVAMAIPAQEAQAYHRAAQAIEASGADAVWVQHEFGIFGGPSGTMLIELLSRVSAPIVVTLHTVIANPNPDQRLMLDWFVANASRIVVMSEQGRVILEQNYKTRPRQIELVHHGVPDRPFGRGEAMRRQFVMEDRKVLLTFGLLSTGKGIETAIAALPAIATRHPDVLYCIAGATHPNLVACEGEAYRERLQALAAELGVERHIRWIAHYLENDELLDLIEAADIYLTPYPGAAQATSGTLSYAVALGKAVVSTPYVHARELLADGNGLLVPFGDAGAIADAVAGLLDNPRALQAMQRRAYRCGRDMVWSAFGAKSVAVIEAVRAPERQLKTATDRGEAGLLRLCDETGMVQHAVLGISDRAHGYCVDDNARALMLANRSTGRFRELAPTFAAFVEHAWNPDTRRYRNFMGFDRTWLESEGSEDSCGRVIWALGCTVFEGEPDLAEWAEHCYLRSAAMALEFGSPRALAFAALGADRYLDARFNDPVSLQIIQLALARLGTLLRESSGPGWCWFEPVLAYDNCRLPEALLRCAIRLNDTKQAEAALAALEWIAQRQTAPAGHFRPVGCEAFGVTDQAVQPFDQQPVDAWASIDAYALAFKLTRDARWRRAARAAYDWFLGANDRHVPVADPSRGTCHDGLTRHGTNRNRGAESVLSWHLAAFRMAEIGGLEEATDDYQFVAAEPATV